MWAHTARTLGGIGQGHQGTDTPRIQTSGRKVARSPTDPWRSQSITLKKRKTSHPEGITPRAHRHLQDEPYRRRASPATEPAFFEPLTEGRSDGAGQDPPATDLHPTVAAAPCASPTGAPHHVESCRRRAGLTTGDAVTATEPHEWMPAPDGDPAQARPVDHDPQHGENPQPRPHKEEARSSSTEPESVTTKQRLNSDTGAGQLITDKDVKCAKTQGLNTQGHNSHGSTASSSQLDQPCPDNPQEQNGKRSGRGTVTASQSKDSGTAAKRARCEQGSASGLQPPAFTIPVAAIMQKPSRATDAAHGTDTTSERQKLIGDNVPAAQASLVDQQGKSHQLQHQNVPVQVKRQSPPAVAPRTSDGPVARRASITRRSKYNMRGHKGTPMQHTPRPFPQHGPPFDPIRSFAESFSVRAVCTGTKRAQFARRRQFIACSSVGQGALRAQLQRCAKGTRRPREGNAPESDTCVRRIAKRLRIGPDEHGLDVRGWHFRWPPPGAAKRRRLFRPAPAEPVGR